MTNITAEKGVDFNYLLYGFKIPSKSMVKFACFAYFLNLNPDTIPSSPFRYLYFIPFFVLVILGPVTDCPGQEQTHDLDYFMQQGIANSPLLKDYSNQVRSGALDSLLIRAANRPQVLANGQLIVAPDINGYGYDQAITNGGTYAAMLSVSQPIFTKKILEPQYEALRLQSASLQNNSKLSKVDLERSITGQYLNAYASYSQYQSNQEVYQLYKDQDQLLQGLAKQGLYKQTDYLNFLVALQDQEISLGQLALQLESQLATLNYICGIDDTTQVLLDEPRISLGMAPARDTSTFFRQFYIDSLTLRNNRAEVDTRYRPSLNWFANAGLNSSYILTAYRNFGASAGINLSVPIYDGKQRQLEYHKLDLSEDTRLQYAHFFNHQYDQQVTMLIQQLKSSDALVEQIRSRMDNTNLLIELNRKLLNTGDVRITDFILAINSYLTIKNDLNQAEIGRWQIINQLNYWEH